MEQEYQQIYAITDPALFKSFPQDPPPPVMIISFTRTKGDR